MKKNKYHIMLSIMLLICLPSKLTIAENPIPIQASFYVINNNISEPCGNSKNLDPHLKCKYYIEVDNRIVAESKTYQFSDYSVKAAVAYNHNKKMTLIVGRHAVEGSGNWDIVLGHCEISQLSNATKGPIATCYGWCGDANILLKNMNGIFSLLPYYGEDVYPVPHTCTPVVH